MLGSRLDIRHDRTGSQPSVLDHFWLSIWLTSVFLRLKVALDFRDDAINIFRGIARLHVKEVSHRLLALALRDPGASRPVLQTQFLGLIR